MVKIATGLVYLDIHFSKAFHNGFKWGHQGVQQEMWSSAIDTICRVHDKEAPSPSK